MPKTLKFMIVTPLIFSISCAHTPHGESSNQVAGSAIGAVTGAFLGNQVKGNKNTRQNARIAGALLGGLLGNRAGNYMDEQEKALRAELQSSGVSVERKGNQITLNMPGNITFASGRANIQPDFYPVLGSVAKVLSKYDKTQLEVSGHTDNVGSSQENKILSQHRASSVASYLRQQGVTSDRILTMGLGESSPIASNKGPDGRAKNRRVEIRLIPM